jgi:hypothetical protein
MSETYEEMSRRFHSERRRRNTIRTTAAEREAIDAKVTRILAGGDYDQGAPVGVVSDRIRWSSLYSEDPDAYTATDRAAMHQRLGDHEYAHRLVRSSLKRLERQGVLVSLECGWSGSGREARNWIHKVHLSPSDLGYF